jgi:hypothetical protein
MRGPSLVLAGTLLMLVAVWGQPRVTAGTEARARAVLAQPRWTAATPIPDPFPAPSPDDDALPAPSLEEPFAIGEALYAEDRVADAVVSLLARMRIPIVAGPTAAPGPLRLDRDEVQTLIDLDLHDLQSADDIENLPYSFADLHAAVAPLLPRLDVEALAAAYQQAYAAHPGDLVPGVLMGQPIEPDTRLTRAQIWLLLMDGFAAPDGDSGWGTADRELPDLPSPSPAWSRAEWREVIARLPLLPVRRLVADDAAAGRVSFRLAATAPALVSRLTGRTLLPSKGGSLAGQTVTWTVPGDEGLDDVATATTPLGQPVTIPAGGVAQFTYQPAGGSGNDGDVVREWRALTAALPACPLISSALPVPTPLCALLVGDRRAGFHAPFQWRTRDRLHVTIENLYSLKLGIPGLGSVTRWGEDVADGTLVRRASGDYVGILGATAESTQTVVGTGDCKDGLQRSTQRLLVEGRVLSAAEAPRAGNILDNTKSLELFQWWQPPNPAGASWAVRPPNDGYLGLEFFPDGGVRYTAGVADPCRPLRPAESHRKRRTRSFLPLNDAQWITAGGGYPLGLHRSAEYYYVDYNALFDYFSVPDPQGQQYAPFWVVRVRRPSLGAP